MTAPPILSFFDTKTCLLLSKYVIPGTIAVDNINAKERGLIIPWTDYLPESLRGDAFIEDLVTMSAIISVHSALYTYGRILGEDAALHTLREYLQDPNLTEQAVKGNRDEALRVFFSKYKFDCVVFTGWEGKTSEVIEDTYAECVISLSNLNLINSKRTTWEMVTELRKDHDSAKNIRRLLTLFYNDYAGKDKRYVEDDLANRVDLYEETIKRWGFETYTGALNIAMSSKMLAGSMAASLVAGLAGAPLAGAAASLIGFSAEIGKIALHATQRAVKLKQYREDNPLAYLSEIMKLQDR